MIAPIANSLSAVEQQKEKELQKIRELNRILKDDAKTKMLYSTLCKLSR